MPAVPPEHMEAAVARLDESDLPIVSMLASEVTREDIAQTLDMPLAELGDRLVAILKRLRRRAPAYQPGLH